MFRSASTRVASLAAAAVFTLMPSLVHAQKALVYCPVGIDATGCNAVVAALAADAAHFPNGADAGYDGTQGTVDLASVDLSGYAVLVVPSLADGPDVQPYALLRNATIAGRIKAAFMGRSAVWSGTPDVGSTNRTAKNELIRNLAAWARSDSAGTHGPGLVALQDNSDDPAGRYGWLSGISALAMAADTTFEVYSNVQVLTATGRTILTNSGGLQIGYSNMASFGLTRGADGSGATDEATGGRSTRVVLVTAAGDPSDPNIATVRTDKEDYQPGDTVTVTGAGWEPGETVSLLFHEDVDPPVHPDKTLSAVADANGHIFNHGYELEETDLGVRFTITATGETSGRTAQATFTDNKNPTLSQIQVFESDCSSALVPAINHAVCAKTTVIQQGGGTSADFYIQWLNPSGGVARATNAIAGTGVVVTDVLPATSVTVSGNWKVQTCDGNAGSPSTTPCASNRLINSPVTFTVPANQPPVLDAVGNKTVNELTALNFTTTATDPNAPPQTLSFSLDAGAPAGANINSSTGAFTWTPTEAQGPGDYPVTIRVTDNGSPAMNDFEAISIHVNEVNVAPILGTIGNKTVDEGTALAFTATATDADLPANTLTFSLVSAPAGASINPSSGAFTWTPTEAQGPNNYTFKVKVTDNGAGLLSDEEEITVHVNEVNLAPALTGVPATLSTDELAAVTFDADATDGDSPAQTLTFSLVGAPTGAAIDPGTGVFTWTPAEDQGPANYTFQVAVSDGVTSTPASITITVKEVNVAPVLAAIGAKTVNEQSLLTFTATAVDADIPANTLAFSLVGAPSGASITAAGVFTWTPTEAQGPNDYTFTVKVTDNGTPALSDEESITVHVNEVNQAPVVDPIADKTVDELVPVSFTATATDPDVPANPFTFSLVGAPAAASIDATTGAFSWTPSESEGPGVYTFQVRATDNGSPAAFGETTVKITVNEVNVAPVLAAIGNQVVNEESALTFTATATDADLPANTLTYGLVGAPAGATISPSGAFSWTPSEAQGPNDYTFTVKVTDNGAPALSDEETISVHVNEVNKAPIVDAIPDQSVDELTALAFTASATDPDIPANGVTYSLAAGPDPVPAGAGINASTGAFSWTPTEAQGPGTYTFKVVATDDGSPVLAGEATVKIVVNEVNLAPVLAAIGNKTVNEEQVLSFTASATDADLPPNGLTFSLVGAPAGASIDGTSGAFAWTPSEAQGPDSYTFTVRVTDDGSPALSDEEEITVQVNEVNVAPVLASIGDRSVDEETPLTFTATATDHDIPANALAFSLDAGAPAGASITAAGLFTWTPTEAQGPGSYPVTIRVTDNGTPVLDDFETITVTVKEVNLAPVLAAIGNKSVNEETVLTFTATATDADVPANTLTYALTGSVPAGAAIGASSGVFSWTPTEAQGPGSYTFTVKVTDNGSPALSDDETITVTVNEVNKPPVVAAIPAQTVNEASTVTFTAAASDVDLPPNALTFSLVGAPAGATINATTGAFSWTALDDDPSVTPSDVYTFKVRATDNGSPVMYGETTVTITVNNVAPVLASLSGPIDPTQVGTPVTVGSTFTDVGTRDTHSGTIDWGDGTASAVISELNGSGSVSGTHAYAVAGVYTVKLTVKDDDNGSSNQSIFQYAVIYDPGAGFVTGGGWIDSPLGAYRPDPSLTGKANFGFVAKYQRGKSVPDGNTEFQFKAGNLNFKSTLYEWLVISGAKGQYKGYGTINGSGNYRFVLTIEDGTLKGTGVDKFRIRIWGDGSDLGGSGLVYDNQYMDPALADAATALGGGSVVIHSDAKTASK